MTRTDLKTEFSNVTNETQKDRILAANDFALSLKTVDLETSDIQTLIETAAMDKIFNKYLIS